MKSHVNGLALLRRVNWHLAPPLGCAASKAVSLTPFDLCTIYSRFRGLDGELWPEDSRDALCLADEGLASPETVDAILQYLATKRRPAGELGLVYCDWNSPSAARIPPRANFAFVGFDVATSITSYSRFAVSAVFQDILFGRHDEFVQFAAHLNEHLLFDRASDAREFLSSRLEFAKSGADIEPTEDDLELLLVGISVYSGSLETNGAR